MSVDLLFSVVVCGDPLSRGGGHGVVAVRLDRVVGIRVVGESWTPVVGMYWSNMGLLERGTGKEQRGPR